MAACQLMRLAKLLGRLPGTAYQMQPRLSANEHEVTRAAGQKLAVQLQAVQHLAAQKVSVLSPVAKPAVH